jgi:GntR family uxuAB operon transcriptional repressor
MASDPSGAQTRRRLPAPVRIYRQVADALEERIASGEFTSGSRLPTERELSAYYGVSRTCIREALLALEIARLVSIRVGSGVYVLSAAPPQQQPSTSIIKDQRGPTELLDARLMFEPEICAAAAANATPEDIARISASLALMREEHRKAAETEHGDRDFHLNIALACGNSIAQDMLRGIWDTMAADLWQNLQKHIRNPLLRLKWIQDHEVILAAIEDRSRSKARAAMRRHIENVAASLDRAKFS